MPLTPKGIHAVIPRLFEPGPACSFDLGCQAVHALAEEKLGSGIEREAEEQGLQINRRAVARDRLDEVRDVGLEPRQVPNLRADEGRPEHVARTLPRGPFGGEDAVSQEGREAPLARRADAPGLEVQRQDRLEVVRLQGHHHAFAQDLHAEGVDADGGEALLLRLEERACFQTLVGLDDEADSECAEGDGPQWNWLAAFRFAEPAAGFAGGELPADAVDAVYSGKTDKQLEQRWVYN